MKTTNTRAHFTGIVRPLTISVLAALSTTSVHAADKLAQTPFYLQNKTTTGSIAIKPNVMLFIDDSGSMNSALGSDRPDRPASPPERSKLQITKDALNALLEQYQDTMNWSLQTLHNNGDSDTRTYTDGTSGNTWKDMQSNIKRIAANQGTPTTRRYYEISKLVRDQTKYRCQKNYIVLMSDGDANMSCGYNPQFNYPYTQNDIAYFGNRPFPQFNCFFDNPSNGYAHSYWDRDDGLRFFSHTLAQKDFKTSGTDAANKSWDGDPADPKESDGTSIYKNKRQKPLPLVLAAVSAKQVRLISKRVPAPITAILLPTMKQVWLVLSVKFLATSKPAQQSIRLQPTVRLHLPS